MSHELHSLERGPRDPGRTPPLILELVHRARSAFGDTNDARHALETAARMVVEPADRAPPRQGGLAPWQERRLRTYVADHIDTTILIEDLARIAGLSCSYLCRAFRCSFGVSPHGYVTRTRIELARRLMVEGDEPLSQIAAACGFADQAHFSRVFRAETGDTPNRWRREHRVAARFTPRTTAWA